MRKTTVYMKKILKNFINDEEGAGTAEYAIILTLVAFIAVTAFNILTPKVSATIGNAANLVSSMAGQTVVVNPTH